MKQTTSTPSLSFEHLGKMMASHWQTVNDGRQSSKVKHQLADVVLSAFACMFFQYPSLLSFQRALEDEQHQNNLRTLFHIASIPSDTQMRDILDPIDTEHHRPVFKQWHQCLEEMDVIKSFSVLGGYSYCPIDGTQFFDTQNERCHCKHCLVKRYQGYQQVILLAENSALPKKSKRLPHAIYLLPHTALAITAYWTEQKKLMTKTLSLQQLATLSDLPPFPSSVEKTVIIDKEQDFALVEQVVSLCGCEYAEDIVHYSHHVLQAAIAHPDKKQVLALMPEFIQNQDGATKQDCERNAAKRLTSHLKKDFPRRNWLIGGDSLYANQPFIEHITTLSMHYLVGLKFTDHPYLQEWLATYKSLPNIQVKDTQGRLHRYTWQQQVPLHGGKETILVNYLHYELVCIDKQGHEKITYQSRWITDLPVNARTVKELVTVARRRWSLENECFNTCKNQGYELSHNYGHGQENLSNHFYLLTMLAFLQHQILFLSDELFIELRQATYTLVNFWNTFRAYINAFIFQSWQHLLQALLKPSHYFIIRAP